MVIDLMGITLMTGCAKFQATTTADLTPFAEQTIAMLGETAIMALARTKPFGFEPMPILRALTGSEASH
jgi:hypothetical protein